MPQLHGISVPPSQAKWKYTGTLLAFHLLLLIVFLLPYAAKTLFWTGVSRMEMTAIQTITASILRASSRLRYLPDDMLSPLI